MNSLKNITLGAILISLISCPVGSVSADLPKPTAKNYAFLGAQVILATVAFIHFQKKAQANIKKVTKKLHESVKPKTKEVREAIDKIGSQIIWGVCWSAGGAAMLYGCAYKNQWLGKTHNDETGLDEDASINDKIYDFFKDKNVLFPKKKKCPHCLKPEDVELFLLANPRFFDNQSQALRDLFFTTPPSAPVTPTAPNVTSNNNNDAGTTNTEIDDVE